MISIRFDKHRDCPVIERELLQKRKCVLLRVEIICVQIINKNVGLLTGCKKSNWIIN